MEPVMGPKTLDTLVDEARAKWRTQSEAIREYEARDEEVDALERKARMRELETSIKQEQEKPLESDRTFG